jgi:SAM-dependent methyltransferase
MTRVRHAIAQALFSVGRVADGVARTSTYIAAGTRQIADLQEDQRRAWELFYANHPSHDSTLMPWEADVVDRFVQRGATVLLVGCGSGRDLVPLVQRGCRVTGLDASQTALEIADRALQAHGCTAALVRGFFEDTPIAGAFDAVIFSYYAYASIPMSGRRIAALDKAASLLEPGGHIVISHAAHGVRPRAILVGLARLAGTLARSDWRIEPGDLVWRDRVEGPTISYAHIFEDTELRSEARAARLTIVSHQIVDGAVVAVLART